MKLFELKNIVSDQSIDRLENIITRKLGEPIYRFGGKTGELHTKTGNGTGYLYFYRKHAFRIDVTSKVVTSIEYWTDGAKAVADEKPNFQLIIPKSITIFQVISHVISFLKKPSAKDITVSADELNLAKTVTEAKRTSVENFITLAKEFGATSNRKSLKFSYQELRDIAQANDVLIPTAIDDLGVRGSDRDYDLSRIVQDASGTILQVLSSSETHHINYALIPTLPKSDIIELEKAVDEKISAEELFDDLTRLVKIIVKGARPSLIVIGGPGTGKTKTIMDVIHERGLLKGNDYVGVKGKISPLALYTSLFLNREKLIVFDDTDSVWGNDDSVNILKAALDSSPVRTVSWVSPLTQNVTRMSDDEKKEYEQEVFNKLDDDQTAKVKLPSEFEFTGKIIFISNFKKEQLDSAVMNRSLHIDMTLTTEQVFQRIEGIMDKLSAPNSMDLTKETKLEVFEFLKDQSASGKMKYVSIRTFIGALGVASSGDPEWRKLLKYMGSD